ncbi:MAG: glycoside hydrolase family 88/105 protein [Thalassotalea sp.]
MKKLLMSLSASCLIIASGCTKDISADTPSSASYIDEQKDIITAINSAADWQLNNMDNFDSYIPSFIHRTVEQRGWVQGAFFLGLARWAEETQNASYFNYLRDHGEKQQWLLGDRRYHADDHVIAQFYLHLYDLDKNPAIIKPLLTEFDAILATPPTSSLDFVPRGKIAADGYDHDCQKRWCWSDALFMSPPVWFHLSTITGEKKYADYADKEFKAVTEYLLDAEYNLYFRDSRFLERREKNDAKIFWSRGNGWVYSGLTQVIEFLPADDPRRAWYIDLFKKMSVSLKKLQLDTGYWPVSLAAGDLYTVPESSGTAFFVSGLAWGLNKGYLNEDYLPTIKTGWNALLKAQLDNGMLGYVQQVGYAPDKVSPNETQLYGAGAFLLAGTEVLKLEQKHAKN